MAHCNTILPQILKFVPKHEFEVLANQHHSGRAFRTASRWSQFVGLTAAQLSGWNSLRDIVDSLSAQAHRVYSLDASTIDLCLSLFPWADFRTTKGAIKLHVGLNHAGYLPEFVSITEGKVHRCQYR
jgi:hypothetical protein